MGLKDQNWSHFWKESKPWRAKEEEEEEEEKMEEPRSRPKRYGTWIFGMKTNLDYEFHEIWHVSLGLYDDYFAQT